MTTYLSLPGFLRPRAERVQPTHGGAGRAPPAPAAARVAAAAALGMAAAAAVAEPAGRGALERSACVSSPRSAEYIPLPVFLDRLNPPLPGPLRGAGAARAVDEGAARVVAAAAAAGDPFEPLEDPGDPLDSPRAQGVLVALQPQGVAPRARLPRSVGPAPEGGDGGSSPESDGDALRPSRRADGVDMLRRLMEETNARLAAMDERSIAAEARARIQEVALTALRGEHALLQAECADARSRLDATRGEVAEGRGRIDALITNRERSLRIATERLQATRALLAKAEKGVDGCKKALLVEGVATVVAAVIPGGAIAKVAFAAAPAAVTLVCAAALYRDVRRVGELTTEAAAQQASETAEREHLGDLQRLRPEQQ